MIIETLKTLYKRDLNKLKAEIQAYKTEENIWKTANEIPNSAGNLCLHLMGNLNSFIGAEIGKTSYIRHRDLEFSTKNLHRNELIKMIEEVNLVVEDSLNLLTSQDLEKEYALVVFQEKMTTGYFLMHLATHLAYHLGQINYHRRLLDQ